MYIISLKTNSKTDAINILKLIKDYIKTSDDEIMYNLIGADIIEETPLKTLEESGW